MTHTFRLDSCLLWNELYKTHSGNRSFHWIPRFICRSNIRKLLGFETSMLGNIQDFHQRRTEGSRADNQGVDQHDLVPPWSRNIQTAVAKTKMLCNRQTWECVPWGNGRTRIMEWGEVSWGGGGRARWVKRRKGGKRVEDVDMERLLNYHTFNLNFLPLQRVKHKTKSSARQLQTGWMRAHTQTHNLLGIHVYYVELINRKNRSKAHPDADLRNGRGETNKQKGRKWWFKFPRTGEGKLKVQKTANKATSTYHINYTMTDANSNPFLLPIQPTAHPIPSIQHKIN